ncbi:MAG: hypothetical protein Q8O95_05785 [bacterium]|nr:hypothetical protein [bacterium]
MVKKFAALGAGISLVALATIVPAFAQTTQSPATEVEVPTFLELSLENASADCTATAGGDCPFGKNDQASKVSLNNTSGYASSFSPADTLLGLRTNITNGANVTAHFTNTAAAADCLDNATDFITDSVSDVADAQAANDGTGLVAATETGLALRLTDATTNVALRGADEDTQWGTTDTEGATALWGAVPPDGSPQVVFDTAVEQTVKINANLDYFIGVAGSQPAGLYACTVIYTATADGSGS